MLFRSSMDASSTPTKKAQLKSLLSKTIHDIYIVKVRQEVGFVLDFKKSSDVIVNFIFSRSEDGNGSYSESFLRILNRLNDIGKKGIDFNNFIDFEREIFFNDDFTRKFGGRILQVINKDFRWNLFFKIIFEIEEGTRAEDFEGFMHYLRYSYLDIIKRAMEGMRLANDEKHEMESQLLEFVFEAFQGEASIDFVNLVAIQCFGNNLLNLIGPINSFDEWLARRKDIKTQIIGFHLQ